MRNGFIALHRKILDNPLVCKDAEYYAVWSFLLLNATHTGQRKIFAGELITINPGMLITGRKKIAAFFKISESKVQRILKAFENEQQIEQRTCNQNRLITVLNWQEYQINKQQNEQPVNNERTTSEQRVNTNNKVNKENKGNKGNKKTNSVDLKADGVKEEKPYAEIVDYLNEVCGTKFKATTKNTKGHINARIKEGFSVDDFKKVIDVCYEDWHDNSEMAQYLRPPTLFNTKFESYLNKANKLEQDLESDITQEEIDKIYRETVKLDFTKEMK